MSARRRRIIKEARAIFWPWCAVMVAELLTWFWYRSGFEEAFLWPGTSPSFWIGIPILASLPFGNEFQHRTFPVLLSQPIDRMKVWSEKWVVMSGAVLTVFLVHWFAQGYSLVAGVWVVTTMCSAIFWTLVARSTTGAVILNLLQGLGMMIALNLTRWVFQVQPALAVASTTLVAAALAYALVMLWLGRRKLARFQVTAGIDGDDLLMTGPNVMRGGVAGLLRCRPSGPVLNLARKEVRLLWPVWMITLLCIVGVVCLGGLQFLPGVSGEKLTRVAVIVVSALSGCLATVLAGSLSMGEERTSGTQSWTLTLPISAGLQWFIKLAVAIFASFAGLAIAVTVAQAVFGAPFVDILGEAFGRQRLLFLFSVFTVPSLLTFAAFWCGCAGKGTIRAALWVFPALGAVVLATALGAWLGEKLLRNGSVIDFLVLRFHPFPFSDRTVSPILSLTFGGSKMFWLVPPLLLALIQSRRLFRREPQDGFLSEIRHLLPVAIVAMLCSFLPRIPVAFLYRAAAQVNGTIIETHEAVGKIVDVTKLDAAHPRQLTGEDLAKAAPLSERARRLLINSTITVVPKGGDPLWLQSHKNLSEYFTTVHFGNDWDCTAYGPYFHCKTPTGWWGYPTHP